MKRIFFSIILLIFIGGCISPNYYSGQKQKLEMSDSRRFKDLPVPDGFDFIPPNSFVYESNRVRIGMLEYQGKAWPNNVVEFYKECMPRYNWRTLNVIEGRNTTLSFDKDDEICIISFECREGKGVLDISISPISEEKLNFAEF